MSNKPKIEQTPTGIIVNMSNGESVALDTNDYKKEPEKVMWVCDMTGLSANTNLCHIADGILSELSEGIIQTIPDESEFHNYCI